MADSRADAIESCKVAEDLQTLLDLEDGPLMQEIRAIYEANRLERKVRMWLPSLLLSLIGGRGWFSLCLLLCLVVSLVVSLVISRPVSLIVPLAVAVRLSLCLLLSLSLCTCSAYPCLQVWHS